MDLDKVSLNTAGCQTADSTGTVLWTSKEPELKSKINNIKEKLTSQTHRYALIIEKLGLELQRFFDKGKDFWPGTFNHVAYNTLILMCNSLYLVPTGDSHA